MRSHAIGIYLYFSEEIISKSFTGDIKKFLFQVRILGIYKKYNGRVKKVFFPSTYTCRYSVSLVHVHVQA